MEVYVVDDDADFRESLSLILDKLGYLVTTFPTAATFLQAAPALATGCVILDLKLPDINGLEVQAQLAEIGDHAVVLLTGYGEVPDAVAAMRAGAIDFLAKPFRQKALLEALARARTKIDQGVRPPQRGAANNGTLKLSPREIEVLAALAVGHPSKVVAHQLGLSIRTIDMHRARIMRKLQTANISSALLVAREAGLI